MESIKPEDDNMTEKVKYKYRVTCFKCGGYANKTHEHKDNHRWRCPSPICRNEWGIDLSPLASICMWRFCDSHSLYYDTECDESFSFLSINGKKDRKFKWCPFCGKRIKMKYVENVKPEPKKEIAVQFLDNGSTYVIDNDRKQIPELQKSYLLSYFDNVVDLDKYDAIVIMLPNGRNARLINDGANWEFLESDNL